MLPLSFQVVQGDAPKLCIHVVGSDGNPVDLSPFSLVFTLKRSYLDTDAAALFQGTDSSGAISVLGASADGVCEVTIPKSATSQMMTYKQYFWDLKLVTGLNDPFTAAKGILVADPTVAIST